jgi:RNA polymerase sigma-70 factor (ECF subfamily)
VRIEQCLATGGEIEPRAAVEAELLQAGQAGDTAALERLLRMHKRSLFTLCRSILGHADDAEDVVQETFLRALRALPGFRPGRASVRTWLFRIAVNTSLNWRRDHRSTAPWEETEPMEGAAADSPEAIVLRRLQMQEALSELLPRQRVVLLLQVLEGWSVAEIAAAVGWNAIRVKHELARARRTLAEWQLRRAGEEGER